MRTSTSVPSQATSVCLLMRTAWLSVTQRGKLWRGSLGLNLSLWFFMLDVVLNSL